MTGPVPPRVLAAKQPREFRQLLEASSLGCPTGDCPHLVTAHEVEDYADDGTPIKPICTVRGCRCGDQWRTT